jgi:hypothetical protein
MTISFCGLRDWPRISGIESASASGRLRVAITTSKSSRRVGFGRDASPLSREPAAPLAGSPSFCRLSLPAVSPISVIPLLPILFHM